jgi:hypothetical protein
MDEIDIDERDAPLEPDFRATVVDGRLTLSDWQPFLLRGGPARSQLRSRRDAGVAIADLRRWRNDDGSGELCVEFVSGGDRDRAERVLEGWALLAGYSRVWFPDRVVELDPDAVPAFPSVRTTCPTCDAGWDDEAPEFWRHVHASGCFPRVCPICGGELPQWERAEADDPAGSGTAWEELEAASAA